MEEKREKSETNTSEEKNKWLTLDDIGRRKRYRREESDWGAEWRAEKLFSYTDIANIFFDMHAKGYAMQMFRIELERVAKELNSINNKRL